MIITLQHNAFTKCEFGTVLIQTATIDVYMQQLLPFNLFPEIPRGVYYFLPWVVLLNSAYISYTTKLILLINASSMTSSKHISVYMIYIYIFWCCGPLRILSPSLRCGLFCVKSYIQEYKFHICIIHNVERQTSTKAIWPCNLCDGHIKMFRVIAISTVCRPTCIRISCVLSRCEFTLHICRELTI